MDKFSHSSGIKPFIRSNLFVNIESVFSAFGVFLSDFVTLLICYDQRSNFYNNEVWQMQKI